MNASIKINLLQIPGTWKQKFQNKDGQVFDCVCIPIEEAKLYQTDESVYLDAQIKPSQKEWYGYDHSIRQSIPKKYYEAMNDEERSAIPYIGNAKSLNFGEKRDVKPKQDAAPRFSQAAPPVMQKRQDF